MGGNQSRQYHHTNTDSSNTSSSHPGWHGGFSSWRRGPIFGWQPQRDHHGWDEASASPPPPLRRKHRSMMPQHILRHLPTVTLERDAVDLLAMVEDEETELRLPFEDEDAHDEDYDSMLYPTTKTKSRHYTQHYHHIHHHQQQQQQHALENVTCGECLICMRSYQTGDTLVSLSCGHSYHKNCLQEWFVRQCVCPYCRHDVEHEYTIAKKVQAFQDEAGNDKWEHASTRPFWLFWGNHHNMHHVHHARFQQHGSSVSSSRRSYYYDRYGPPLSPYSSNSSSSTSSSNDTTKLSLVNVLRRRQDVWKHAEHQRTVLEQLSFSSTFSSSSSSLPITTRMRGTNGVAV